jgi:hypothetical protein
MIFGFLKPNLSLLYGYVHGRHLLRHYDRVQLKNQEKISWGKTSKYFL